MKTTLEIDATVMAKLRREAARSGRAMSELVRPACACCFNPSALVPDGNCQNSPRSAAKGIA